MYYKVVDINLRSIWVTDHQLSKALSVQYILNNWAYPNKDFTGSRLMVFNDYHKAHEFAWGHSGRIYECDIKNPSENGLFVWTGRLYMIDCIKNALKDRAKKKKYNYAREKFPEGTVFCTAVKLTKEIKNFTIE